jgi:epoxyqueuosine reductase
MSTATKLPEAWKATLESACQAEGILLLGFTHLEYRQDFERFQKWLGEKRHAELSYLERHLEVRKEPSKLLEGAQSAAIVAIAYFHEEKKSGPQVARYALYPDYHRVLKKKATRAAEAVFEKGTFRVTVDSAPLLERALAAKTARGFVGKNTLYIHPQYGSFLLLGEILTQAQLPADSPPQISIDRKTREGGCGPCKLCQTACPTGALDRAYSLETNRCLSYWTIEQRGPIPEEFWPWMREYYFGCDLCQLACPYNLKTAAPPADWKPRSYPPLEKNRNDGCRRV